MNWVEPVFKESYLPPKKKQKTDQESDFLKGVKIPSLSSCGVDKACSPKASIWLERFKPNKVEDLVVHKKKIEEVESWLINLQNPNNSSQILLVTGPSGCGKLTTVKVLSKKLDYGLTEWMNPLSSEVNHDGDLTHYRSQLKVFAEFIIRASRYKSVLSVNKKRIIIIKEIPNVFLRDNSIFHECLKQYSSVKELNLVFIISDTLMCRDLFPDNLKGFTKTTTINFNPITQRLISSTLQKIVKRAGITRSIDHHIDEVSASCSGDLRNAIMSLQFLSVKSDGDKIFMKLKTKFESKKKDKKSSENSSTDSQLRNSDHLDIFRGLGRILYSKKDEQGKLVHNPEEVISSFDSCASNFVYMLEENYLSIFSCIYDVSKVSGYLASSELMLSDWKELGLSRNYALSTAVQGTVLNNSVPIRKFQQLRKHTNINSLDSKFKTDIATNFPSFRERDFLVDVKSYFKIINNSTTESQLSLLNELKFKNRSY